jgi:hypothetical protein
LEEPATEQLHETTLLIGWNALVPELLIERTSSNPFHEPKFLIGCTYTLKGRSDWTNYTSGTVTLSHWLSLLESDFLIGRTLFSLHHGGRVAHAERLQLDQAGEPRVLLQLLHAARPTRAPYALLIRIQ